MWCSHCQQDVPGIAVENDGSRLACARCQGNLKAKANESPASQQSPPVLSPLPPAEDWSLDSDLAAVTRVMRSLRIDAPSTRTLAEPALAPARDVNSIVPIAAAPPRRTLPKVRSGNAFAWPTLMVGMMAFTCGAVLLGWSFATGRGDLWTFGMPAVLAGQGLLVLGLILQLEGLWQSSRDTRETLADLDRELSELRHATAVLSSTHTAPGQSFYAHMAEGASPHLLLADVKGQLDIIAMRLAEARK